MTKPTICVECRHIAPGPLPLRMAAECRAPTLPVRPTERDVITGEFREAEPTRCWEVNDGNCPHYEAKG